VNRESERMPRSLLQGSSMASISKPGVYIYKNNGYMLTAFCDRLFIVVAISGFLAGPLPESPVLWSVGFT
jgi:hypothetical protein